MPGLELQYAPLQGHRMAYRIGGSGPPLLLVHGLLQDSMTWRRLAPLLAEHHTVIAIDLMGHGASAAPAEFDYTVGGGHAWMLRSLLDHLGIERAAVLGHSIGGAVAMALAGHHPNRVSRLALIAPGAVGPEVHGAIRAMTVHGAGGLLSAASSRPVRTAISAAAALTGARTLKALNRTLEDIAPLERRHAFLRTVRGVIGPRGQLATMAPYTELWNTVPVLIVWGERDRILPHQQASAMPGARVILVEDAGHLPHLTHAQAVAEEVERFMLLSDAEPPFRQVHVSEARSRMASS